MSTRSADALMPGIAGLTLCHWGPHERIPAKIAETRRRRKEGAPPYEHVNEHRKESVDSPNPGIGYSPVLFGLHERIPAT